MKKKTILSAVILSTVIGGIPFNTEAMDVEGNEAAAAAPAARSQVNTASDEVMTTSDIRLAIALAKAGRRVGLTVTISEATKDVDKLLKFSSNAKRDLIDISCTWLANTLTEEKLTQLMAFPNIARLNLRNTGINDTFAEIIAQGIERNKRNKVSLKELDLSNNDLTSAGARVIINSLTGITTLEGLNLSNNAIGGEGIEQLADALRGSQLKNLNLYNNKLGIRGAQAVARFLRECATVEELELGLNGIDNEGAQAIADTLRNCPRLRRLGLTYNNIGVPGIQALAEGFKAVSLTLETLRIGFNSLEDEGTEALVNTLRSCKKLKFLDLESSKIGVRGAQALADLFREGAPITCIHLGGNSLGDEGTEIFAGGLENSTLDILDLSNNKISGRGAYALATLLGRNHTIRNLGLGINPLGDVGIEILSRALGGSKLNVLHLNATGITHRGIWALRQVLGPDSALTHLILGQNPFERAEILDLAELIESENKIRDLNLNYCGINYEGMEVLVTSLMSRNTRLNTLNLSGNNPGERGNLALDRLLRSERAPGHLWR